MRSKAHFQSHPIHPMLVAFPIAFLCGTLGFDAADLRHGAMPWHGSLFDTRRWIGAPYS